MEHAEHVYPLPSFGVGSKNGSTGARADVLQNSGFDPLLWKKISLHFRSALAETGVQEGA